MGSGWKGVAWEEREGLELCEAKGFAGPPHPPPPVFLSFPFLLGARAVEELRHLWGGGKVCTLECFLGGRKNHKVATTLQL